jgi:hypothetical protein
MIRRILGVFFAFMMVTSNVFAWGVGSGLRGWWRQEPDNYQRQIKAGLGHFPQGLTFYKDFTKSITGDAASLNADYSIGSPVSTFTRTAVNCTYVDSSGVVRTVATANVPRIQGGYYDATGFHTGNAGIMAETSATNRATYSGTPENAAWTKTNITADNDDAGSSSPDSVATAGSLTATANNGTFVQAYAITGAAVTYTASVWMKRKTGTGTVNLGMCENGTGKAACTLTTSWRRFTVSASTDGDDAGKDPAVYIELETNTDAVYIYGMQLETGAYATSYIPNATTANTRGAEVLKYLISGNRTAAQETIVIKFTPSVSAVDLAQSAYLTETVIKGRIILLSSIGDDLAFQPNGADSGVALMRTGSGLRPLMNVTYIACAIAMASTGNPNMGLYVDNTSYDSTTQLNTDWTVPAWGSFFTIGCNSGSAFQLNGVISSIALFNRSLSSTEVLALNKLM